MRHFDTTSIGIYSPELRQAQKAVEDARGLRSCAKPVNMALPGLYRGGPYTGSWSPRGDKLGCGLSWVLGSTHNVFAWAQIGIQFSNEIGSPVLTSVSFVLTAGKTEDTSHCSQALLSAGLR